MKGQLGVMASKIWFRNLLKVLCLGLAPMLALAQTMVSVDRPEINMRAGPGTQHEVMWQLARGYPLQVIRTQGDWIQVQDFENDQGWVSRSLTARKPHHIVKSKVANLRNGPGTNHRVLGRLDYGDVLQTLGRQGDWVRVRTGAGQTGWVARNLLWGW